MGGLRSEGRPLDQMLRHAEIDRSTGKILINGDEYDLRKIQNVELVRIPHEMVNVYIGYLNPTKRTMFTRVAVDRIPIGSTQTSSDIANIFRHQIGVPVIEF